MQNRSRQQSQKVHFRRRKFYSRTVQFLKIVFYVPCRIVHNVRFFPNFFRIFGFIIRIGNRDNQRQVTQLPDVHVFYNSVRHARRLKKGRKFFQPLRCVPADFGECRSLNKRRRKIRFQHAVFIAAARPRERRGNASFAAQVNSK